MRFTRRLAVVVAICTIWLGAAAAYAQPSLADLAAKSRPSDLPGTEQEWIVRTVVSRLAVLAALPSAAPEPTVAVTTLAASPAVFSVSVNGATAVTVKVVGHIWDPRTYLPVAAALGVRASSTDGATPATDAALAEAVSSLSLTDLLDHDAKVSAALRERPRSAALHEQAALLLGAFSADALECSQKTVVTRPQGHAVRGPME